MPKVELPEGSIDVVRESVSREKEIVERKIEKYSDRVEDFEDKHGMDSEEFLDRFESGELGDDKEWFEWKADYQALERLKGRKKKLEMANIE